MKKILVVILVAALCIPFAVMAADEILIGVQAPITGAYAYEGQGIENAVKLIVDQQNAKGGLLGKKLRVITCDDKGTAVQSAICGRNLVSAGVIAVIGSYTSTAAQAAQSIYFRAGVLQTTDGTSDDLIKHGYWTFFRNSFPNSAEATFTADYLVKQEKYKRIAILSDYSVYSDGLGTAVEKAVKDLGGNVIYRGKITAGAQNFTPILTKIKSMNADVIYFSGYYTDGGLIRAQQKQLGITAPFVGGDSNDNKKFIELAGDAAPGAYIINVPTPELLPYPLAKEFLKDYETRYHQLPPSIWTLMNADGLRAILYAIQEEKTTDTKVLAKFLHNLKDFQGITGNITFTDVGERVGSLYMAYEIQNDGSYKIVYREK